MYFKRIRQIITFQEKIFDVELAIEEARIAGMLAKAPKRKEAEIEELMARKRILERYKMESSSKVRGHHRLKV